MKKESGLRFNQGKQRYDLQHPVAVDGIVRVLTKGATKYAPRNWEKGISWTACIASLKRHLAAFEKGIDFDEETGELHIDHIQCNAHFLSAFYKIAPEFDDRLHIIAPKKKIGLDIDEVICDWIGGWQEYWGMEIGNTPTAWAFDYEIREKMEILRKNDRLDKFYLSLKPKCKPEDIPFEPHCYVTSRPVKTEITKAWLENFGFPLKPVITVAMGESKLDAIKATGLDWFVDDRYENYEELNRNGICCFLFDAEHNKRYNVGYKRLYSLKDLKP